MPSLMHLKGALQGALRPLALCLCRRGVAPTLITAVALGLSLGCGAAAALLLLRAPAARGPLWLIVAWAPLRILANTLDGMVARLSARTSRLGALLSEVGDALSDVAMGLPFALAAGAPAAGVVLAVALGLCAEIAGLAAAAAGGARRFDGLAKPDRLAGWLLLALWLSLGGGGAGAAALLAALCGASLFTLALRVRRAL